MMTMFKSEIYRGNKIYFVRRNGRVEAWLNNKMLADNKTKEQSFKNAKERIDYALFMKNAKQSHIRRNCPDHGEEYKLNGKWTRMGTTIPCGYS